MTPSSLSCSRQAMHVSSHPRGGRQSTVVLGYEPTYSGARRPWTRIRALARCWIAVRGVGIALRLSVSSKGCCVTCACEGPAYAFVHAFDTF